MATEAVDTGAFPTEFEIPRTKITPWGIMDRLKRHLGDTQMLIAEPGMKVKLPEEYEVSEKNRTGEAFVLWGEALNGLNGTYMEPEHLMDYLHPVSVRSASKARSLILGDNPPLSGMPLIVLGTPDGMVNVNIFAGATCKEALEISEIGNRGVFSPEERLVYQSNLYEIFRPTALVDIKDTKKTLGLKSTDFITIDEEDCLATGDTEGGVGLVLQKKGWLPKGRRIDVANATAQALVVLGHLAQQQKTPIEINVGYLSFGLSQGIGPRFEHKNYITLAPLPELQAVYGERIFVVGDMGEAAKRLARVVWWDEWREDWWGQEDGAHRGREYAYTEALPRTSKGIDLRVGYEKGGLLMMALAKYAFSMENRPFSPPLVMGVGKRLDLRERGFGLRLDNLLEAISVCR